jgi:hypothetical protein
MDHHQHSQQCGLERLYEPLGELVPTPREPKEAARDCIPSAADEISSALRNHERSAAVAT